LEPRVRRPGVIDTDRPTPAALRSCKAGRDRISERPTLRHVVLASGHTCFMAQPSGRMSRCRRFWAKDWHCPGDGGARGFSRQLVEWRYGQRSQHAGSGRWMAAPEAHRMSGCSARHGRPKSFEPAGRLRVRRWVTRESADPTDVTPTTGLIWPAWLSRTDRVDSKARGPNVSAAARPKHN